MKLKETSIEQIEADLDQTSFNYHQLIIESSKKDGDADAHILGRLKEAILGIIHKQNVLRKLNNDKAKDELFKVFDANKELLKKIEKRLENDNKL